VEAIRPVAEDIIRAAPQDNTGLFVRQLLDDVVLGDIDLIRNGKTACRPGIHDEGKKKAAGMAGILALFPDIRLIQTALLGDPLHQRLVVTGYTEPVRDHLRHGVTAASEFSTDCNYSHIHSADLLMTDFLFPRAFLPRTSYTEQYYNTISGIM
jgi:hypothetical protein